VITLGICVERITKLYVKNNNGGIFVDFACCPYYQPHGICVRAQNKFLLHEQFDAFVLVTKRGFWVQK
jgi:hypothetical protein